MTDMDPKIRADLDLIRKSLDLKDDSEAAGVAVEVLADHCRHGRLIVSPQDLWASMIGYSSYVLSTYAGKPLRVQPVEDGTFGIVEADAMPEPVALH